ncbi:MAG: 16S rRNA (cytidine(1402)-2'-O)-methyltransferase [Acidobacteriota bacterium]
MSGTLYVVATPIGNLEDLGMRALEVLSRVDLIACEDTRHTRKMLSRFQLSTPTTSYHEHNEDTKSVALLRHLRKGQSLALVSDAGTPLLSDPGYRLVKSCREEGVPVVPIPGPFAGAAAASVCGLPTDQILFGGFLGSRPSILEKQLAPVASCRATLVYYLAPHRLRNTLEQVARLLGDRPCFLIREMTKLHEESLYGPLSEVRVRLQDREPRGEYTLVIQGARDEAPTGDDVPAIDVGCYVAGLVQVLGLSRKDAVRRAATELGLSRQEVYRAVSRPSNAPSEPEK